MFCPHCGNQIPDDSTFCPNCGAQVQQSASGQSSQQYVNQGQQPSGQSATWNNANAFQTQQSQVPQPPQPQVVVTQPQTQAEDSGSFGWAVLGFFIPLVGLILWLVWKDDKPKSAKNAGIGALVGFILSIFVGLMNGCASLMLLA